jgi:hypothetical protein
MLVTTIPHSICAKMKTMKKLFFILMVVAMASCSDDEVTTPDFVPESLGTYAYTQFSDLFETETGTMVVSQQGSNVRFTFDGDSDNYVETSAIERTNNGYAFRIASRTVTEDGISQTVTGVNTVSINDGAVEWHGLYLSATKTIDFSATISSEGDTANININGTKQ